MLLLPPKVSPPFAVIIPSNLDDPALCNDKVGVMVNGEVGLGMSFVGARYRSLLVVLLVVIVTENLDLF